VRTTAIAVLIAGLLAAGCNREPSQGTGTSTEGAGAGTAAPDNTGRNERDRAGDTTTPPDQQENQADVRITADIRKAILDDKGMSVNAQNCKVVTQNGVVTLRGPVDSQAEKDSIEAKARAVTGVTSVVNELEVKGP
jgi:hyperosmotically inducible periplasmic protein